MVREDLEKSSLGHENVNDVHLDIGDNSDKLELVTSIGQYIFRQQNKDSKNELLTILKKHGHEYLTNCYSAILRNLRKVITEKTGGADYVYHGLLNRFRRILWK